MSRDFIHTHTRARARAHTHAHTHTHIYIYIYIYIYINTVTPRLTKIIRSAITFVSRNLRRNVISCRFLYKRKQPSRVGGSPLCDVVSSFL